MAILVAYRCGHIGRNNLYGKVHAFIRVAEIRKAPVITAITPCPDCKRSE